MSAEDTRPARGGVRRVLGRATGALAVVLVTGAALEGIVRLSGYADRYVYGPVYEPWRDPEAIPYVQRPGLRDALGHSRTRFSTDALGLRSEHPERPLRPKPAGEYRVAVLGDSITFGQGVATNETFCSVLEARLGELVPGRSFRVLNFGVSGYSVKEMFATLRQRVPEVEPDLVLLAIIFSDFELERCGRVDRWGYLHNRKVGSYDDPDALRYLLLRRLHLTYVIRDAAMRLGLTRKAGSAWPAAAPGGLPTSFSYVTASAQEARARGLAFLVVLLPSAQYDGSELAGVRRRLEQDGTSYVDFSRLRTEFSLAEYSASRHDPHPGPAVHRRIGSGLAQELLRRLRLDGPEAAALKR